MPAVSRSCNSGPNMSGERLRWSIFCSLPANSRIARPNATPGGSLLWASSRTSSARLRAPCTWSISRRRRRLAADHGGLAVRLEASRLGGRDRFDAPRRGELFLPVAVVGPFLLNQRLLPPRQLDLVLQHRESYGAFATRSIARRDYLRDWTTGYRRMEGQVLWRPERSRPVRLNWKAGILGAGTGLTFVDAIARAGTKALQLSPTPGPRGQVGVFADAAARTYDNIRSTVRRQALRVGARDSQSRP